MSDDDAENSAIATRLETEEPELFLRSQWSEQDGDVLWFAFPICEPPYVGSPLVAGYPVKVIAPGEQAQIYVGGWPGYHTHWCRIPFPRDPETITLWPVDPVEKEFLGKLEVGIPYQGRIAADNPDQLWVIGDDNEERLYPKRVFVAEALNGRNEPGTPPDGRG